MESFWTKIKSWKRWAWIIGTSLPVLTQALTGTTEWPIAIGASLLVLMVGMSVIGKEDAAKIALKVEALKLEQAQLMLAPDDDPPAPEGK